MRRTLALALAVLFIVPALPLATAAPTCVNTLLFNLCVNDPTTANGGSMSVVDGVASATASGGLVLGAAGPAVITATYTFSQATVLPNALYTYQAWFELRGPEGIVASQFAIHSIDAANPADDAGTMTITLASTEPLVGGGSVMLRTSAWRTIGSNTLFLGEASSTAPIIVGLTPSATQVQNGVHVTDALTVATGTADFNGATLTPRNGELMIAAGTHFRAQAEYTYTFNPTPGTFSQAYSYAQGQFCASLDTGYSACVSRTVLGDNCYDPAMHSCTIPATSRTVTLEVLIPGNAREARSVMTTSSYMELNVAANNFQTNTDFWAYWGTGAQGRNVLYAVGP